MLILSSGSYIHVRYTVALFCIFTNLTSAKVKVGGPKCMFSQYSCLDTQLSSTINSMSAQFIWLYE